MVIEIIKVNAAIITCKTNTPPCTVSEITRVKFSDEEIEILGHPSDYVDNVTASLTFKNSMELDVIPTKLFDTFSKLNSVTFSNVSLNSVNSHAFVKCGNLKSIFIIDNNFLRLPSDLASTCSMVGTLYTLRNNINEIDDDLLKGLTNLKYFSVAFNNITCIPRKIFQHTPTIFDINLSNNQISVIDTITFRGLENLNQLSLMSNRIVNLPAFDFTCTGLNYVMTLFYGDNPINSVSPKMISSIINT